MTGVALLPSQVANEALDKMEKKKQETELWCRWFVEPATAHQYSCNFQRACCSLLRDRHHHHSRASRLPLLSTSSCNTKSSQSTSQQQQLWMAVVVLLLPADSGN